MKSLCIAHGNLYAPEPICRDGFVLIEGGVIVGVGHMDHITFSLKGMEVIDANGCLVVPGFVDLQVNGAFGYDFTQEPEAAPAVAARLTRRGVTSFCPTLVTTTAERYAAAAGVSFRDCTGAQALGWHLEGPYLSPRRAGAHDRNALRDPLGAFVYPDALLEKTRLVTLAPELPGADTLIERLRSVGIVVSAGHSEASYAEAAKAFERGVRCVTHLFNAMRPFNQREPGLIGAALDDPRAAVGLIVDGVHLHPAAVRLAWRAKGPERIALVTDAVAAAGQPAGLYRLGNQDIQVDEAEGSVRLNDGTLAGSMLTMDEGLRKFIDMTSCSLSEALFAVSTTPARVVGLGGRKGRLVAGYDADLVLLTSELHVATTIAAGRVVFPR